MMNMLDKEITENTTILSNAGERKDLPSNKTSERSPALDVTNISEAEDVQLNKLAKIVVDFYLWKKTHGTTTKKCSDLLPSFNKRTSRRR